MGAYLHAGDSSLKRARQPCLFLFFFFFASVTLGLQVSSLSNAAGTSCVSSISVDIHN